MNQELMTLDFWQDTVIYEGKTFPVGTLACDALNVPATAARRSAYRTVPFPFWSWQLCCFRAVAFSSLPDR